MHATLKDTFKIITMQIVRIALQMIISDVADNGNNYDDKEERIMIKMIMMMMMMIRRRKPVRPYCKDNDDLKL